MAKPKYTIKNFRTDFPDDKACLGFIFKNRWPQGLACPACQGTDWYPVEGRKVYSCKCGHQVSPTEGTIFHKSPTPLSLWFYAIFLMSQSKNGVSAKEIQRQIGVTYKCAWRMQKQIRLLMSDDDPRHLPTYLDEFSLRYNHRKSLSPLPVLVFAKAGRRV